MHLQVAVAGQDLHERSERRAAEEQQQAQRPRAEHARAPPPSAGSRITHITKPDGQEQREDREAAVVEQLPRPQPLHDLARTVGVVEDRALVDLGLRGVVAIREQRNQHPGRDSERADRRRSRRARRAARSRATAISTHTPTVSTARYPVMRCVAIVSASASAAGANHFSPFETARHVSPHAIGRSHMPKSCVYTPRPCHV